MTNASFKEHVKNENTIAYYGGEVVNSSTQLVRFIQNSDYKVIKNLVNWLESNLSKNEEIEISQWIDEKFYVEVIDRKIKYTPGNSACIVRIAFTVDVKYDMILWNNYINLDKGNNWVRDRKWIKALNTSFPCHPLEYLPKNHPAMHWHKETPSSRTQERQGIEYRTNQYGDRIPFKKPKGYSTPEHYPENENRSQIDIRECNN